MKLKIDNLDGGGLRDYSAWLDAERPAKVTRKLNAGSAMEVWLAAEAGEMAVPRAGAKVLLLRDDESVIFSGYVEGAPELQFAGSSAQGSVFRCKVVARGEETRLDRKTLAARPAMAGRSAGEALRAVTQDAGAGGFDTSGVQDVCSLGPLDFAASTRWSDAARQIAGSARASWRLENGAVKLTPIGATVHTLSEGDRQFTPSALDLRQCGDVVNEIAVEGGSEPEMYVRDYFIGDGVTYRFPMSMMPFLRLSPETLLEEEYAGAALSSQRWSVVDDNHSIGVSGGKLKLNGTAQATGRAWVCMAELLELGGGLVLEHGAVTVNGDGVLGGIYAHPLDGAGGGANPLSDCIAGFTVSSQGATLRAVVNGSATGATVAMLAGQSYVLRTRVFSAEAYRVGQRYRSSTSEHQAAGAESQRVRFVLEVQEIDPTNPASQVQEATVLYDGEVTNAPALATYAVVNGPSLKGAVSYTRLRRTQTAEVRVYAPDGSTSESRLIGVMSDGAQCSITREPAVYFYGGYTPGIGEQVVARYRSSRKAGCRVNDPASITANASATDDGVRAASCRIAWPKARTSEDCEAAVLALLDDTVTAGWEGQYATWADFLPNGAKDVFPGDGVHIDAPERGAVVDAVVREVAIEMADAANDRGHYTLKFSNDAAETIALQLSGSRLKDAETTYADGAQLSRAPQQATSRTALGVVVPSLPDAQIVEITGTAVTIDAGVSPPVNGGFEVRSGGDWGWGTVTDRNLQGRFATRSFMLPKVGRGQDYYLRMYDGATPRNYSKRTTLLHVDVKNDSI